ncbi:hypothetical protein FB106_10542 [Synechococcus sp. Ace-Pa]|nr:hypothetical protein FB106_10542 [Synechococcus sp. Ace-Pa]
MPELMGQVKADKLYNFAGLLRREKVLTIIKAFLVVGI